MRALVFSGLLAVGLMVASSAMAETTPTGLELGLRTGYALPLGSAIGGSGNNDLSNAFSGVVPIWIDAGYRITPSFYVGGFFQYGVAVLSSAQGNGLIGCGQNGISCSGSDIQFGAEAHYHFLPGGFIDPWVGLGLGYEFANISASAGTQSESSSFGGFQFLNVQAGGDFKLLPALGIGPFVMLSLDEYGSCSTTPDTSCSIPNKAVHEWLTLGVRGVYDIHL
jgi:hypothetical protein